MSPGSPEPSRRVAPHVADPSSPQADADTTTPVSTPTARPIASRQFDWQWHASALRALEGHLELKEQTMGKTTRMARHTLVELHEDRAYKVYHATHDGQVAYEKELRFYQLLLKYGVPTVFSTQSAR